MAKPPRRSLVDALAEPSAADFIKQGTPAALSASKQQSSPDIQTSGTEATQEQEAIIEPFPAVSSPPVIKPTVKSPAKVERASEVVVDPGLVSVTYRIPGALVSRVVRESTERKIQRKKPWTQQEIMAIALEEWLERNESK